MSEKKTFMLRLTVDTLIKEINKHVTDFSMPVRLKDVDEGYTTISDIGISRDENEDPKEVLIIRIKLPLIDEADNGWVYTDHLWTVKDLVDKLKNFNRELFVIMGVDVAGRFVQNVRIDNSVLDPASGKEISVLTISDNPEDNEL